MLNGDVPGAVIGKVCFPGHVAAENAVGVLDGAALPGRMGVAEDRLGPQRRIQSASPRSNQLQMSPDGLTESILNLELTPF